MRLALYNCLMKEVVCDVPQATDLSGEADGDVEQDGDVPPTRLGRAVNVATAHGSHQSGRTNPPG